MPIVAGLLIGLLTALLSVLVVWRRNNYSKKRMSDERYKLLLDESEIILMDFDCNHNTLAYSRSAVRILGIPDNTRDFHTNYRAHIHPDDLETYIREIENMYLGKLDSYITEIRLCTASGNYEYFLAKARALVGEGGKPRVCGILININEQKLLQTQMEQSLYYDELTSAMNRGKFISECDKTIESGKDGLAVICIDVNHLATINNLCGYDMGDSVLKRVAAAIYSCIDGLSCVFGRLGNDDFALLVSVRDASEVEELFGKISAETAKISVGLEIRIPVHIHGGFSFFEKGDTILTLLTKASAAQRIAKVRGDALVNYEQGVRLLTLDRDELSRDIIESHINGCFEMWYQPKVDSTTQKLVGAEALMRWNHPQKGKVPPSIFIELAEQMRYIDVLDSWAINEVCKQNKIWQDKGFPHIRVSANVSKSLFRNADLLKSINEALAQTGLGSECLDIEITESLAVSDPEKTVDILSRIRETGITVSMDDFGSGYASLGALKMLPFDTIKIDRSLIFDIDKNETSMQIVKAIMDMAGSIKLNVVAEGAETASQVEYLGQLGCNVIQGFYFGKPVPADEFEEYFTKYV